MVGTSSSLHTGKNHTQPYLIIPYTLPPDIYCSIPILLYSDTRDPDGSIPKCFGEGEHGEDILSLAGMEPNLLASSRYDGDILLWNVDSERCVGEIECQLP